MLCCRELRSRREHDVCDWRLGSGCSGLFGAGLLTRQQEEEEEEKEGAFLYSSRLNGSKPQFCYFVLSLMLNLTFWMLHFVRVMMLDVVQKCNVFVFWRRLNLSKDTRMLCWICPGTDWSGETAERFWRADAFLHVWWVFLVQDCSSERVCGWVCDPVGYGEGKTSGDPR